MNIIFMSYIISRIFAHFRRLFNLVKYLHDDVLDQCKSVLSVV
jgi:hypothetical protein